LGWVRLTRSYQNRRRAATGICQNRETPIDSSPLSFKFFTTHGCGQQHVTAKISTKSNKPERANHAVRVLSGTVVAW